MTKTTKFYKQLYFRVICAIIVGITTSVLFAKTSISAWPTAGVDWYNAAHNEGSASSRRSDHLSTSRATVSQRLLSPSGKELSTSTRCIASQGRDGSRSQCVGTRVTALG